MAPPRILSGSSGFSFKPWKGSFYPSGLADRDLLAHYAKRLAAVEINNTFYRMPRSSVVAGWAAAVPDTFRFAIKASQRITHRARLKEPEELVGYLWKGVEQLGARLGAVLFQLPPQFPKDTERLRTFLAALPKDCPAALEFRHRSWEDEEVHAVLREHGACLVVADSDERPDPPLVPTAEWGYLRLRGSAYDGAKLRAWIARVAQQPWREAFVFFKHNDDGPGPDAALAMAQLLAQEEQ